MATRLEALEQIFASLIDTHQVLQLELLNENIDSDELFEHLQELLKIATLFVETWSKDIKT